MRAHCDVPDFADVIAEAIEMVEKGCVTEQDFREFTFTNAAMLHTRNNPGFFKGTVPMSWAWKEHRQLRPQRRLTRRRCRAVEREQDNRQLNAQSRDTNLLAQFDPLKKA